MTRICHSPPRLSTLQIDGRLVKPQRLGVVDCGFGTQEITGLVVQLDGVSPEPMFYDGVVFVLSPESLGLCAGVAPQRKYPGNGIGQSDPLKFIQEPFKEAGRKPRRFENNI